MPVNMSLQEGKLNLNMVGDRKMLDSRYDPFTAILKRED